jgi:transposase
MRRSLPVIRQSVEYLKKLLRRSSDARAHERLQLLYLIKTEQVRSRTSAASLLGVHRNTVCAWLKEYERVGLKGLLSIGTPEGAPPALDVSDQKLLQKQLRKPEGFASYAEAQAWIANNIGVSLSYSATYYWVHIKSGGSPKVARPSHIKKTSRQSTTSPMP